jgi:adenylate kinase family enzyme
MQRIMIIGCCGSGKSTLARKLQTITSIPLYHLDQFYWNSNWTPTPDEEWAQVVKELADEEVWIIDGNYGGTMDFRMNRADTIIYMDFSTVKCLARVIKRTFKHHGKVRPDMPEGCKERFEFEFLHYVATYNMLRRKSLLAKLDGLKKEKQIITLKNEKDIENLLKMSKFQAIK